MVNIGNKVIFRGSGNTNTIELVPRKKKMSWETMDQGLPVPALPMLAISTFLGANNMMML